MLKKLDDTKWQSIQKETNLEKLDLIYLKEDFH